MLKHCAVCSSTERLLTCSRCKRVDYCSRDHQKADWKRHKHLCIAARSSPSSSLTPKPNSSSVGTDLLLPFKYSYRGSPDGKDSNLLILFHGLGDSIQPYETFSKRLELPQTCVLCIQGPVPVFDFGWSWIPSFTAEGHLREPSSARLQDFSSSIACLSGSLLTALEQSKLQRSLNSVFLMGFAQGAEVAFHVAVELNAPLAGVAGAHQQDTAVLEL